MCLTASFGTLIFVLYTFLEGCLFSNAQARAPSIANITVLTVGELDVGQVRV